jgi:hypothetical protein
MKTKLVFFKAMNVVTLISALLMLSMVVTDFSNAETMMGGTGGGSEQYTGVRAGGNGSTSGMMNPTTGMTGGMANTTVVGIDGTTYVVSYSAGTASGTNSLQSKINSITTSTLHWAAVFLLMESMVCIG